MCMRAIVNPLNFKLRPTVLLAENLLQLRANSLRLAAERPQARRGIAVSTSIRVHDGRHRLLRRPVPKGRAGDLLGGRHSSRKSAPAIILGGSSPV